jgi:hypothetical protein
MKEMEENSASNEFTLTEPERKQNVYAMQRLLFDEDGCLAPDPSCGIIDAKAVFMRCVVGEEDGGTRAFGSNAGHITAIMRREMNPAAMSIERMTLDRAAFWIDVQLVGMDKSDWCWVELVDGVLTCSPAGWLEPIRQYFVARGIISK